MEFQELQKKVEGELAELYNSETNIKKRNAQSEYKAILKEIDSTQKEIDILIAKEDFDEAVKLQEHLANIETKRIIKKRILDNYKDIKGYDQNDVLKIVSEIVSNQNELMLQGKKDIFTLISEVKDMIENLENMTALHNNLNSKIGHECYVNDQIIFEKGYQSMLSINDYVDLKGEIKNLYIGLNRFLEKH